MNIIVQSTLLNIVKLVFPAQALYRAAGQIKGQFDPEHKRKAGKGIPSGLRTVLYCII